MRVIFGLEEELDLRIGRRVVLPPICSGRDPTRVASAVFPS